MDGEFLAGNVKTSRPRSSPNLECVSSNHQIEVPVGLFTFFKQFQQRQKERAIAKNQKLVQNAKAIREERVAALGFFSKLRDPEISVPALLKRFEYSLDHGINDTREKESAMEGILSFGEIALPHVQAHLAHSTRIAWPIKIYQKLASEESVASALEACLFLKDFDFDRDKIDKNYDILCYLRDYPLPDKGRSLVPLVQALDERVRLATVEVILAQGAPDCIEKVEKFIADETPENTRIHQVVIDAFVEKQWPIRHLAIPEGSTVAPDVLVTSDRRLRRL